MTALVCLSHPDPDLNHLNPHLNLQLLKRAWFESGTAIVWKEPLILIHVFAMFLCNRLQKTATRCNALQHAATHCNTLQHIATHCSTNILTHVYAASLKATRCNAPQHPAPRCNTLQNTSTHFNTRQHDAMQRHDSYVCSISPLHLLLVKYCILLAPCHMWRATHVARCKENAVFLKEKCMQYFCSVMTLMYAVFPCTLFLKEKCMQYFSLHLARCKETICDVQHTWTRCNPLQHPATHCNRLSFICGMIHSYVTRYFSYITWLLYMQNDSCHLWRDSFLCNHDLFTYVTQSNTWNSFPH